MCRRWITLALLYPVLVWSQTVDTPEWTVVVPAEPAVVDGIYTDPRTPLVVKRIAGIESVHALNFDDLLVGESLPANAAIQAISFRQTPSSPALLVLDVAMNGIRAGVVMECGLFLGSCVAVLDPVTDLGLNPSIKINALWWNNTSEVGDDELAISFDQHILGTLPDELIEPRDAAYVWFRTANPAPVLSPSGATFFNGDAQGIAFDLNGYTRSVLTTSVMLSSVSNTPFERSSGEITFPDTPANEPDFNAYDSEKLDALASQVTHLTAIHRSNSGWVEFMDTEVTVTEGQGLVSIPVRRIEGFEKAMNFHIGVSGTAQAGTDVDVVGGSLSFANEDAADSAILIDVLDDLDMEGTETLNLNLVPLSFFAAVNPAMQSVTINIIDNDDDDLIFRNSFE